ncbi:hypothetical protein LHJ74_14265 [Streptomyces sp. N2-109]|uniref:Uncharacterized protein n=1 Tax=Streptomyces gossypii TaxID=2883101 RepID=A0ABT2JT58_9ACTN|nr:hypothetical protein [Streptomyces gossypii]MCT2591060.1 hypothetical protein [Streptomyces gossypii]
MSSEPTPPRRAQLAYDPARDAEGVVHAVFRREELLFDPKVSGNRVAFLRAERGGPEWTADADALWPVPPPEEGQA